ncbi:MAG: CYTH domain-containing protein [Armatimonadota bacterium]
MQEQTSPPAEAEVKIELDASEYQRLPEVLARLAFTEERGEVLTDYYLEYAPSPVKGYDFTRLRVVNDAEYMLTVKRWVHDEGGHGVRLEDEHPVTAAEAHTLRSKHLNALALHKTRREFRGQVDHLSATVALDHLTLGEYSRYFLECEVMTTRDQAQGVHEKIVAWMRASLPVHDLTEAPSMLEILQAYTAGKNSDRD